MMKSKYDDKSDIVYFQLFLFQSIISLLRCGTVSNYILDHRNEFANKQAITIHRCLVVDTCPLW